MELRQLEHFVAAAEEHSFTRAARRMHIVQSGLSMSIRALEEEFGTPLFVRQSRRVELTPAGLALFPEAKRALEAVRAARDAVGAADGMLRGKVRIGVSQAPPPLDAYVQVLSDFRQLHPGVSIHVFQAATDDVMGSLMHGDLDLALCSTVGEPPPGVRMTPVQVSTLVALCPRDHPLAESETVTLSELAKYPMVDLRPGWTTRRVTDLAFEREGIVRQWACEVNDLTLLVRLVEHGLGVCIAPRAVERMNLDVHVLRIMPPLPEWALAIHYLESRTVPAAARVLIDMLEERLTRVASDAPVTGRAGGRRSGGVNGG